ncbi:hypothetical protein [Nocardioides sp. Kera G14]|uniref:hypothetical protein n=1 Tax=Nocardioides sp. Kera G14 TaxID=2884264 RepID=UPI001D1154EC|nr:hypothetical protein [Nocardioides sp. Kera G14]UDY23147.1 hypothetical protein LH076_13910 [Nocardioides sp. Kera G14]
MLRTVEARRRLAVVVAAVVVLLLIWGGASWWSAAHRSQLVRGLSLVPGDAQRVSWTDWSAVTDSVGTKGGTEGVLSRAYDADLSAVSALTTSAPALDKLGLPLTDVDWELFAQADDGAVELLHLADASRWESRLAQAGWTKSGGVYDGSNVVPDLDLTPELTYVTRRGDVLVASDNPDYAVKVADQDFIPPSASMVEAAKGLDSPVAGVVFSGDYTCGHLAMSQADDVDQAQARVLLKAAGTVDPIDAFAFAYAPDGDARVSMEFENDDVAKHNADARATLASGDAPGQGGSFRDRFTLGRVEAHGSRVTMDLKPKKGQSVLSDLSSGPVLWASC